MLGPFMSSKNKQIVPYLSIRFNFEQHSKHDAYFVSNTFKVILSFGFIDDKRSRLALKIESKLSCKIF